MEDPETPKPSTHKGSPQHPKGIRVNLRRTKAIINRYSAI
jgi:hypothetical protein